MDADLSEDHQCCVHADEAGPETKMIHVELFAVAAAFTALIQSSHKPPEYHV